MSVYLCAVCNVCVRLSSLLCSFPSQTSTALRGDQHGDESGRLGPHRSHHRQHQQQQSATALTGRASTVTCSCGGWVGGGGGGREQWRRVVELLPCEFSSTSQPAVSANQTTWQTWRWGGKAREIQARGVERRETQFVVVETIDNLLIVMPIWVGEQGMTDACVCVCVCLHACVHVCVCVCVCVHVCVCVAYAYI